jgi:hypothetical protein
LSSIKDNDLRNSNDKPSSTSRKALIDLSIMSPTRSNSDDGGDDNDDDDVG